MRFCLGLVAVELAGCKSPANFNKLLAQRAKCQGSQRDMSVGVVQPSEIRMPDDPLLQVQVSAGLAANLLHQGPTMT